MCRIKESIDWLIHWLIEWLIHWLSSIQYNFIISLGYVGSTFEGITVLEFHLICCISEVNSSCVYLRKSTHYDPLIFQTECSDYQCPYKLEGVIMWWGTSGCIIVKVGVGLAHGFNKSEWRLAKLKDGWCRGRSCHQLNQINPVLNVEVVASEPEELSLQ